MKNTEQNNLVRGTFPYISPQIRVLMKNTKDERYTKTIKTLLNDLYALGILLYFINNITEGSSDDKLFTKIYYYEQIMINMEDYKEYLKYLQKTKLSVNNKLNTIIKTLIGFKFKNTNFNTLNDYNDNFNKNILSKKNEIQILIALKKLLKREYPNSSVPNSFINLIYTTIKVKELQSGGNVSFQKQSQFYTKSKTIRNYRKKGYRNSNKRNRHKKRNKKSSIKKLKSVSRSKIYEI